jgi:hypothetical protein
LCCFSSSTQCSLERNITKSYFGLGTSQLLMLDF